MFLLVAEQLGMVEGVGIVATVVLFSIGVLTAGNLLWRGWTSWQADQDKLRRQRQTEAARTKKGINQEAKPDAPGRPVVIGQRPGG